MMSDPWSVDEQGPVMVKLSAKGAHKSPNGARYLDFVLNLTIYAHTPWFEIQYRIINRLEPKHVLIKKIALDLHFEKQGGDYALATSNYRSDIRQKADGSNLRFMINADYLLNDANEHIPEVFYFPKALTVDDKTLSIEILPEEHGGSCQALTRGLLTKRTAAARLMASCIGGIALIQAILSRGAAAHWVDIDVCHYDTDPLRHGAQIEHSKNHVTGPVEISHEWVAGLFAYYYQTGDKFAYDTAIGIGHNIMRHLELPKYQNRGNINARDTGWALRAL